jgi:hypothetical protein
VLALHHARQAVKWTLVVSLGACALFAFEALVLHGKVPIARIAARPLSLARVVLGYPHFLIAFYFLLAGPRLRSAAGWLRLGLLLLASVALCWGCAALGGYATGLVYVLTILYFFFHVFRDESYFYRTHAGPAIPAAEQRAARRANVWMEVAALSLVAALLVPFHLATNRRGQPPALEDWSYPALFAALGVPLLGLCALALWRLHREHPAGLRGVLHDHWPLARVLAAYVALLGSGLLLGAWTIEFLVLLHFVGWFYFAIVRIGQQPPGVEAAVTWHTPTRWFKRNRRGFWVLHGGLAALTLFACVLAFWLLPDRPVVVAGQAFRNAVAVPLNNEVFYHLTVAHVTLSLFPR